MMHLKSTAHGKSEHLENIPETLTSYQTTITQEQWRSNQYELVANYFQSATDADLKA